MVVSSDFTAKVKVWGAGGASGTQNPSAGGGGGNAVADVTFSSSPGIFWIVIGDGTKFQHGEPAFRGGGSGALSRYVKRKWWRIFWYFAGCSLYGL